MKPFEEKIQKGLLLAGLAAFAISPAVYFAIMRFAQSSHTGGCLWFLGGLYCPACGGTRAFGALINGRIAESLTYNPTVLYAAIILTPFVVSTSLYYLRGKKGRRFQMRPVYILIGLAIFLLQCAAKNFLLIFFGITVF